jgi:hypothetical protein
VEQFSTLLEHHGATDWGFKLQASNTTSFSCFVQGLSLLGTDEMLWMGTPEVKNHGDLVRFNPNFEMPLVDNTT